LQKEIASLKAKLDALRIEDLSIQLRESKSLNEAHQEIDKLKALLSESKAAMHALQMEFDSTEPTAGRPRKRRAVTSEVPGSDEETVAHRDN
jgi:predicted RNase H-like nuclease (RuvC/YqgF family)